ncbi:hypothetical protein Btru_006601 [Bulinus truncatus]|nr:hypothetical protein Btru_006601 [Bulinus truncatus]
MKLVFLLCFIFLVAVKFCNCDDTSLEVALRDADDDDDMSYERFMDAEDVFELVQKVVRRSMRAGIRASDLVRIARDVKENADRLSGRVPAFQIEREISEGARKVRLVSQVRALFGNNVIQSGYTIKTTHFPERGIQ